MSRERLIYAYIFERAERCGHSHFGGPLPSEVIGQTFGPKPLHQVARLSARHIPALGQNYTNMLPLIFGMHFDGCQLSYRGHYSHKVEILKIEPDRSLEDWPYPNFPPLLPYNTAAARRHPTFGKLRPFRSPIPEYAFRTGRTHGVRARARDHRLVVLGGWRCNLQNKEVTSYAMTD